MWENPRPVYPNELYHHGIKGQHWGVRNGPPYPLNQDSKDSGYRKLLDRGDKAYNLDKWGKSPNTNCLYVTGYSGSGKSTLAKRLAKNGEYIELDHYVYDPKLGNNNEIFNNYLKKYNPEWHNILNNNDLWVSKIFGNRTATQKEKDYYWNASDKFMYNTIPNFAKEMYKHNKKVVVEGVQFMDQDNGKFLYLPKGSPMIIKGTSFGKSTYRAIKRDYAKDHERVNSLPLNDKIKYLKSFITRNPKAIRRMRQLKKELK